jgi:uncharacterized protein (TIRG00374 family)
MLVPGSIPNIILSLVTIKIYLKNSILYKYINLLFRFTIGVGAVWFIYLKLNSDFLDSLEGIKLNWSFFILTIFLLFVNWGIEALKWRFAIKDLYEISFIKALKLTFTGITIGLLTPNRIGEIPARAALLKTDSFKAVVLKTLASSFSQVVITFLLGGLGLVLTQEYFNFNYLLLNTVMVLGLIFLITLYFNVKKLLPFFERFKILRNEKLIDSLKEIRFKELFTLLLYSLVRYFVFSLQYWLVLKAFGIELSSVTELFLIPVCFLLASSIPTILISEIGIRGSVALFVFSVVSDLDIQIVLASVLLWLINVALPAIFGLYDLKELKLLKDK